MSPHPADLIVVLQGGTELRFTYGSRSRAYTALGMVRKDAGAGGVRRNGAAVVRVIGEATTDPETHIAVARIDAARCRVDDRSPVAPRPAPTHDARAAGAGEAS